MHGAIAEWVFAPTGESLSLSTATKKLTKESAVPIPTPSGFPLCPLLIKPL